MRSLQINGYVDQNHIYMNDQTLAHANITTQFITLHFGSFKKRLRISIDNQLQLGTIVIPQRLSAMFSIPEVPYEWYFRRSHLHLGPVIGFITSRIYYEEPQTLQLRFSKYQMIKGLVFICLKSTINSEQRSIEGYFFNPGTNSFTKGIFPYPNVMYSRVILGRELSRHLYLKTGKKLFNYPYNITKKRFWELLSNYSRMREHLPKTVLFNSKRDLRYMVSRYRAVYLKPTNLSQGRGIYYIRRTKRGFLLQDTESNQVLFKKERSLALFIKKQTNREYLIQQGIPSLIQNRKVDFRVYFQKDHNKKWYCAGMETKIAKPQSIISNSKNRVDMMPGDLALTKWYRLNTDEVRQMKKRLIRICLKSLGIVEKSGYHLGEAAIDFIIDKNLKIWLLEMQINYAAEKKLKRSAAEQELLPTILPAPFIYAKALAGFTHSRIRNK